jgi:hypothetical protein
MPSDDGATDDLRASALSSFRQLRNAELANAALV